MLRKTLATSAALLLLSLSSAHAGVHESIAKKPFAQAADLGGETRQLYIIQMEDPPALALHKQTLRRSGVAAEVSERFDPQADDVRRYINQLQAKQNALLLSLNLWDQQVYSYSYTLNGIAVKLTPTQAQQLRLHKGVNRVWEDKRRPVATSDSPGFLGLLDRDGGLRNDLGLRGENVIIGVIDSGISPNHPSFADVADPRPKPPLCRSDWAEQSILGMWLCRRFDKRGEVIYAEPTNEWQGICATGPGFTADNCNNKLIGARFYRDGFEQDSEFDEDEFDSPADADGHGTHIASIAAGNEVNASIFGAFAGRISGVAPRARIAVYKACWLEPGASRATCSVADLQKAIEDAVADGVDVINYSIGDLNDSLDDPDDLALLAAADAGVVSAVATGNDGPSALTIQSPATTPWVISVGATSRAGSRVAEAIRITSPASLAKDYESREAGFTPRLTASGPISGQLVLADDGSSDTPDSVTAGTEFDACSPLQNSSAVSGNIVLIQRGGCNFDRKLAIAGQAGARAAVVFSNDMQLIVMDGDPTLVNIPAVMIGQADGQLLRDKLLAAETVELTLDKALFVRLVEDGNVMGSFSGRGPSFGDSDFLKPDLVAPGTAILGAQTPNVANGYRGEQYQYLSGTSQATPHVAGTAALLKEAHPEWSPAEIKSALMTSSRQDILKEDGRRPADPFDMGAGHIVPNTAVDPGLLYPLDNREYDAYLCTIGLQRITDAECRALAAAGFRQDARDINLPSIAITELVGEVEVTRRVVNPGAPAQFTLETSVPEGIELQVTPETLTLGADESAEFTLRFSATGSGVNEWHYGNIRWVNENHQVYSPFVVQPTLFSLTKEIFGSGSSGSVELPVSFGYSGEYAARINGLILPCVLPDQIKDDDQCINTEAATVISETDKNYVWQDEPPVSVKRFLINVPEADDELLRIALYDELTDGAHDLDLYLYYCDEYVLADFCPISGRSLVASSVEPNTSNEMVEVFNPAAGQWVIDVHAYNTEGDGPANFRLYSWAFGSDIAAGNLRLGNVPAGATAGTTINMSASWSDLPEGLWLGGVSHSGAGGTRLGLTVVEIDNRPPLSD
jgi:subtilisin family serine protease